MEVVLIVLGNYLDCADSRVINATAEPIDPVTRWAIDVCLRGLTARDVLAVLEHALEMTNAAVDGIETCGNRIIDGRSATDLVSEGRRRVALQTLIRDSIARVERDHDALEPLDRAAAWCAVASMIERAIVPDSPVAGVVEELNHEFVAAPAFHRATVARRGIARLRAVTRNSSRTAKRVELLGSAQGACPPRAIEHGPRRRRASGRHNVRARVLAPPSSSDPEPSTETKEKSAAERPARRRWKPEEAALALGVTVVALRARLRRALKRQGEGDAQRATVDLGAGVLGFKSGRLWLLEFADGTGAQVEPRPPSRAKQQRAAPSVASVGEISGVQAHVGLDSNRARTATHGAKNMGKLAVEAVRRENRRGKRRPVIDVFYIDNAGQQRRYRRDATTQTRSAAIAEAKQLLIAVPEREQQKAPACIPLFKEFVDGAFGTLFLPHFRPATRERYAALLRQGIMKSFASKRLDAISTVDLLGFAASLMRRKVQTRSAMNLLRTIFRCAVDAGVLVKAPVFPKLPRLEQRVPQVPSNAEVTEYLAHATGWLYVLIALSAYAGLRMGEGRALEVRDINFEQCEFIGQRSLDPLFAIIRTPPTAHRPGRRY